MMEATNHIEKTSQHSIPDGWREFSLGELGEVKMCKRVMKYQTLASGEIPFFKIGTFGGTPDAYISRDLFTDFRSRFSYPKKGDILLSAAGTIGRTVVFDGEDSYFQDSNIVWIDNKEDKVLNSLLYYCYKVMKFHTENGGIVVRLYNENLRNTKFCVPESLEEQKKIAEALTAVDNMIATLDEAITKKRQIKEGLMQQLLTGEAVIPGFSGEWQKKRVGDIGFTYSGLTGKTKNDFGHGEAQYITFLNVLNNPVLKTDIFERVDVRDDERQNAAKKGDLFFNTSSETPEDVGICALLNADIDNLYLNSFCFGFRLTDSDVDGLYLSYFWRSKQGREIMSALAQGATRYNLSKEYFNKAIITLPPIELQRYIANTITAADKEIAELEQKRDKYLLIKQGMMQELLTGKTRLV